MSVLMEHAHRLNIFPASLFRYPLLILFLSLSFCIMHTHEVTLFTAIIITAIVLAVIISYFVWSIIRQQRRAQALHQQLLLTEMATLEQERSRTAADLHDELGPLLSAIRFRIDHARGNNEDLAIASNQIDEVIVRLRAIAGNLMPLALQRKGLITALQELIRDTERHSHLQIPFSAPAAIELSYQKSIHLYRVLQEVIHNCIKHAGATQLNISITKKETRLLISCRDNGRGFDLAQATEKGIGLKSLRNRTELTGGQLHIETGTGKGTWLLFDIPLHTELFMTHKNQLHAN